MCKLVSKRNVLRIGVQGASIVHNRNEVVRQFLASDASRLLFVDSDMTFDHTLIDRLAAHKKPIVSALCLGQDDPFDPSKTFTTIRVVVDGTLRKVPQEDLPMSGLIACDAVGAAALLVEREVFEALASRHPEPFPFFQETALDTGMVSEDIVFCMRAQAAGYDIYVDTLTKVGHIKTFVI